MYREDVYAINYDNHRVLAEEMYWLHRQMDGFYENVKSCRVKKFDRLTDEQEIWIEIISVDQNSSTWLNAFSYFPQFFESNRNYRYSHVRHLDFNKNRIVIYYLRNKHTRARHMYIWQREKEKLLFQWIFAWHIETSQLIHR